MSRSPIQIRASVLLYRMLICCYPADFRRQYGREMTLAFEDWATDLWKQSRWLGLITLWLQTTFDFVGSAAVQHVTRLRVAQTASDSHLASCRKLVALGAGFAVLNSLLWYTTPTLRAAVDSAAGRLDAPDRPFIVRGVQELLVYFDPWLAWYVFPVVFTIGFASIPFFWVSREQATDLSTIRLTARLLLFLESVWLFLIWVGVWCRGPCWHFYWPGEAWDSSRVEVYHRVDLSDCFWTSLLSVPTQDMPWLIRELPGFLLLLTYFFCGFLFVMRNRWNKQSLWRLAATAVVLLLAIAIPTKMFCTVVWDLRYVVTIPEMQFNI